MLHILRDEAAPAARTILRGMYAARKSVFVDLLGWDVPVLEGAYEVDQFDDEHATYLILADADGGHLGSARLLRTDRPHILDSFYAHLCGASVPRGGSVREVTRFCLDRRLRAVERRAIRNTLIVALAEHALREGITSYSAIADLSWAQQILAFGWEAALLGQPRNCAGTMLTALRIEIEAETPQRLAATGIVPTAVGGRLKRAA